MTFHFSTNDVAYYTYYMHNIDECYTIADNRWYRAYDRTKLLIKYMDEFKDIPRTSRNFHMKEAIIKLNGEWKTVV